MNANTFGSTFQITTYGESHGKAVGVRINGCPKDIAISLDMIQEELNRRKPGTNKLTSPRKEPDKLEVISGIINGKSTGGTIQLQVKNIDTKSKDYDEILHKPRPGHADLTYYQKYGQIPVGGGRASGRETIGRVIAGSIAKQILQTKGITIHGQITEIHGKKTDFENEIIKAKKKQDSVGGIIQIEIIGMPPGIGEPVFEKLDANIAKALMSIGGVKGIEIGDGFQAAKMKGSEHNDTIVYEQGKLKTKTNHAGGIIGGISNGMPIIIRIAVKPTSSIGLPQETIDLGTMEQTSLTIQGRHDPCLCLRIVPVAESMVALVLIGYLIGLLSK